MDWGKARRRDLRNSARRAEIDEARYFSEIEAPRRRALQRGPATLRCTCGHSGRVNTAINCRFRCSRCGKLWSL
jgi:hypothetical protein